MHHPNTKTFSLQDLDHLIDEGTLNNINKFAKTFENIFKNEGYDLGSFTKEDTQTTSQQAQSLQLTKLLAHDVIENGDLYELYIDVPGISKDNISMNVISQNQLQIQVEKKTSDNLKYLKRERTSGGFSKELILPKDADLQTIKAKYDNGVLFVTIMKTVNPYNSIKVNIQ
jgi:HSP20 family protein